MILDNGSTSESYDKLLGILDKRVNIIRSEKNLGFAVGINFSYLYLKKNNLLTKYILLLNPDAVIKRNSINKLYAILCKHTDVAVISPRIVYRNNKIQYSGSMVDWKRCEINNMEISNPSQDYFYNDIFHGCACLLDVEKFEEAGKFDDSIFMYYDEAFLSMQFSKLSYKIIYAPKEIVYHKNSHSLGNNSFLKSYYHTRNHLMFFKQYSNGGNMFCKYMRVLKDGGSLVKHLQFTALFGMFKGIFHFWTGKTGKL